MNCIPRFEAETYCASVGKRLPTDAEFEYAARGGRAENYCPWGPMSELEEEGRGSCVKRRGIRAAEPVCSHPDENSLHGLCDMAGSVSEFVMWTERREAQGILPEAPDGGGTVFVLTRGGILVAFEDGSTPLQEESVTVGFRCVRDVNVPGDRDGN
jgi:formylglycine-generating enzyme required for sulfatase activity